MEKKKYCLNCNKENVILDDNHNFCIYCGKPLYNQCENNNCINNSNLPDDAAYCPTCGYETSFKSYGIIKRDTSQVDLPF